MVNYTLRKRPFFMINPKSYLDLQHIVDLAIESDRYAKQVDFDVYFTAPFPYLKEIAEKTTHLIVTAQHMDSLDLGRGMGFVSAVSLKDVGARAVMLNHAEHALSLKDIVKSIEKAKEKGLTTIVCADSVKEAKALAILSPNIILCEPTELIGTGKTSDSSYVEKTNSEIRAISSDILVMQAAGITTPEDVYNIMSSGADGTGCTSGIVLAENPSVMVKDMLAAVTKACHK